MGMNLRLTGAKTGDFPVGKSDKLEVVGGVRREQCINEVVEVGEQNLAETRIRFPCLNLNSKAYGKGKRSDFRRSYRTGRGLVVEVDVIGRRRVSWVRISNLEKKEEI